MRNIFKIYSKRNLKGKQLRNITSIEPLRLTKQVCNQSGWRRYFYDDKIIKYLENEMNNLFFWRCHQLSLLKGLRAKLSFVYYTYLYMYDRRSVFLLTLWLTIFWIVETQNSYMSARFTLLLHFSRRSEHLKCLFAWKVLGITKCDSWKLRETYTPFAFITYSFSC